MTQSLADFDNAFLDKMIELGYSEDDAIELLTANGQIVAEIQREKDYDFKRSLDAVISKLS